MKVGDKIRDNDPRMYDRVLTITHVDNVYITAIRGGFTSRILTNRVHKDGKPRRSGFTLLAAAHGPAAGRHLRTHDGERPTNDR